MIFIYYLNQKINWNLIIQESSFYNQNIKYFFYKTQKDLKICLLYIYDSVVEWYTHWFAKPTSSAHAGSSPVTVVIF